MHPRQVDSDAPESRARGVCSSLWVAEIAPPRNRSGISMRPRKTKSFVLYAAEQQQIAAGKRSACELHFRVIDGFHVNSHTPSRSCLIPTRITLQPTAGVKERGCRIPCRKVLQFQLRPHRKTRRLLGRIHRQAPSSCRARRATIEGALRYQACDHAACYPPKTLPVQVIFTAK